MFEIVVALILVLLIAAVPRLRRAALSLLGLLAIIGVGSAVFSAVIWGIYQSKPWLGFDEPAVVSDVPTPGGGDTEVEETPGDDLTAALAAEDTQRLQDEQQRQEEEKLHTAILAARARVILEEDRKLAEQATSFPLPPGIGERLDDILAIRVPAWRDKQIAADQQEAIRAWLRSIGLTAEETASIVTAKSWGSLYDLWRAENQDAVALNPQAGKPEVASTSPPSEPPPEEDPFPDPEQPPAPETLQEGPPFLNQAPPPRARFRTAPNRVEVPRRSDSPRRSRPRRDVGPFGF